MFILNVERVSSVSDNEIIRSEGRRLFVIPILKLKHYKCLWKLFAMDKLE